MSFVPPTGTLVQVPALQFNQPISEASQAAIAGLANYLFFAMPPIGSILYSMLTNAQLQSVLGVPSPATWALADGSSCAGTAYGTLTGFTTLPDLRGIFVRGKNNGRADGKQNPDGDLALGTYTADRFAAHNHGVTDPGHVHAITDPTHNHTHSDPGHIHSILDTGHIHLITDPGHAHTQVIVFNHFDNNVAGIATDTPADNITTTANINASGTGISINNHITGISIVGNTTGITNVATSTGISIDSITTGITTQNTGSGDTAPKNVTVNCFIRIN